MLLFNYSFLCSSYTRGSQAEIEWERENPRERRVHNRICVRVGLPQLIVHFLFYRQMFMAKMGQRTPANIDIYLHLLTLFQVFLQGSNLIFWPSWSLLYAAPQP